MHDLKIIRDDITTFHAEMKRRGIDMSFDHISVMAIKNLADRQTLQAFMTRKNEIAAMVGKLRREGGDISALTQEGALIGNKVDALMKVVETREEQVNDFVALLPNFLTADVPAGLNEADNVFQSRRGTCVEKPLEHFDIPGIGLDFEAGAKLSGSRFTVLRDDVARMARALGQFMLDWHIDRNGYREIAPPVLVRSKALYGTGQFPKFETDVFQAARDLYLAPTSEVMLTNLYADTLTDAGDLPIRMAALTDCFRLEAGSAGRDTRGLIRQHQFQKVELVSIVTPDESEREHERMTSCAEGILAALGLPFRRMLLCAGDTGFSARKTYDLEVWMAGGKRYREISSCSNCGEFQARRMSARVKLDKKNKVFAHTLNGSGVAVGRALAAIIELYQDGKTVIVPEVLQPYMGNIQRIG